MWEQALWQWRALASSSMRRLNYYAMADLRRAEAELQEIIMTEVEACARVLQGCFLWQVLSTEERASKVSLNYSRGSQFRWISNCSSVLEVCISVTFVLWPIFGHFLPLYIFRWPTSGGATSRTRSVCLFLCVQTSNLNSEYLSSLLM